jgi:alcohol dehydrogenase YqhD (iron-dependent ADH family)
VILTSVWGVAFTISTALAWGKINQWGLTELGYELLTYGILIGAVTITNIYPQWLKHHRHSPVSHKKS